MKLEPHYFREKTTKHYRKSGMSWHGCLISFWTKEDSPDGETDTILPNKIYFDHITDKDNKQDHESVILMLEAILLRLKKTYQTLIALFSNPIMQHVTR